MHLASQLRGAVVHCANLELLNFTYCLSMVELSLECPQLRTLMCSGCQKLPDAVALAVLECTPALRTFELKGCPLVSAPTLELAAAHCTRAAQGVPRKRSRESE